MTMLDRREARRERRRHQTIALAIRHRARNASGNERRQLQQLLADDDALEAAILAVDEQAPDEGDDGQADGPFMKLFKYLIDNFDKILPIILKILGMFSGVPVLGVDAGTFETVNSNEPSFSPELPDGPSKSRAFFAAIPQSAQKEMLTIARAFNVDYWKLVECLAAAIGWKALWDCIRNAPGDWIKCAFGSVDLMGLVVCLSGAVASEPDNAVDPEYS